MNEILVQDVRQLIAAHPEVVTVLKAYGVDCAPNSAHTCHRLKDIVVLHRMSADTERRLLNAIARVVAPDRAVRLPMHTEEAAAPEPAREFSAPVRQLIEDHALIRRWIALIPLIVETLDLGTAEGRQRVLDGVDFILGYTGKLYHAKEEKILFQYFDEKIELIADLCADHDMAIEHAEAICAAVEAGNSGAATRHLLAYAELLRDHIKKEDETLYPWIDRELSPGQVEWLRLQFQQVQEASRDLIARQREFIERLERQLTEIVGQPA